MKHIPRKLKKGFKSVEKVEIFPNPLAVVYHIQGKPTKWKIKALLKAKNEHQKYIENMVNDGLDYFLECRKKKGLKEIE